MKRNNKIEVVHQHQIVVEWIKLRQIKKLKETRPNSQHNSQELQTALGKNSDNKKINQNDINNKTNSNKNNNKKKMHREIQNTHKNQHEIPCHITCSQKTLSNTKESFLQMLRGFVYASKTAYSPLNVVNKGRLCCLFSLL